MHIWSEETGETGGQNGLGAFHRLELGYGDFLKWLIKPPETISHPLQASVNRYHPSLIRDMAEHRKSEIEEGERTEYGIPAIDDFAGFVYFKLSKELLDALVFVDGAYQSAIILRRYWPEEFEGIRPKADEEGYESVMFHLLDIKRSLSNEQYMDLLKQKIPLFPPEVHEMRMRTLEDTLKVLNALYDATMAYCRERGYLG